MSSTYWLIPQMPTSGYGLGRNQELGTQYDGPPTWLTETQVLEPSTVASQGVLQLEAEKGQET